MGTETLTDEFALLKAKLHRVACRMLNDECEAQDAVQDTFCNMWNAPMPETAAEARFKLIAVLRNVCLNKIKRIKPVYSCDITETSGEPPADIDEFDKTKPLLLATLSPLQRQIFEMSVFDDYEYEEIALRLDMSIEAVRMNMTRARKKVREQYERLNS